MGLMVEGNNRHLWAPLFKGMLVYFFHSEATWTHVRAKIMPQTDARALSTSQTASDVTQKGQRERKPSTGTHPKKPIWEEENNSVRKMLK